MLIKALCDYYDILESEGKVIEEGYSYVDVKYCIALTQDGKIDHIINIQSQKEIKSGKKTKTVWVPQRVKMPKRSEKSAIEANIPEHRAIYIFGLDYVKQNQVFTTVIENKSGEAAKKPEKSHFALVNSLDWYDGIDSPVVNAYRNFLLTWIPENETANTHLLNLGSNCLSSYYTFCLNGSPDLPLHEDPAIRKRWDELYEAANNAGEDSVKAQCPIMGEVLPTAGLHGKITGIIGGQPSGCKLICFNNPSENSYGVEQSYNSHISCAAMLKYTTALNTLLNSPNHRTNVEDITAVSWAVDSDERYTESFHSLMYGSRTEEKKMSAPEAEAAVNNTVKDMNKGVFYDETLDIASKLNQNVDFYIAGLKPNSSRLALKFLYHNRFGQLIKNIDQHQKDIRPFKWARPVMLWQLTNEFLMPNSDKDKLDPALTAKIMESIINGYPYPYFMLSKIICRIRADTGSSRGDEDDKKSAIDPINSRRIGIIKGYINRNARIQNKKEEITLALDYKNMNSAYLCGRLFAVLEEAQKQSAAGKLNRTIKDAYFSSASTSPAVIMPQLMKRSQYYLEKIENSDELKKLISIIVSQLGTEFPNHLSLIEQGKFIIGYYHQNSDINYHNSKTEE